MNDYRHVVQYYETDKMGVTHHSNYIRWMEEARVDFLTQIGWDYTKLESMGVISAVVNVTCDFRYPTTFADEIFIRAYITEFRGVTLKYAYEMKNSEGVTVCTGTSSHAFLSSEGRPINVKRKYPELYEAFSRLVTEQGGE